MTIRQSLHGPTYPEDLSRTRAVAQRGLRDGDILFEAAKIHAREGLGVLARLLRIDKVQRGGELNVIDRFHGGAPEPQSDKIIPRPEQDLTQQKAGHCALPRPQADKLPFLRRVRVDHAVAAGIIEDDRQVGRREVRCTFELDVDAQVTAWVSDIEQVSGRVELLDGNGSEASFSIPFSRSGGEVRTAHNVEGLRVI